MLAHLFVAVVVADHPLEQEPGEDEAWDDEERERRGGRPERDPHVRGHHAASEASGSASSSSGSFVSPRVFVARSAITAEARMQMLPIRSARWKPAVSAC